MRRGAPVRTAGLPIAFAKSANAAVEIIVPDCETISITAEVLPLKVN
jgi:hypothetical protein